LEIPPADGQFTLGSDYDGGQLRMGTLVGPYHDHGHNH
jgi:hypothetical protein